MQLPKKFLLLTVLVFALFIPSGAQPQVRGSTESAPSRISQALDNSQMVTLPHNVHPLARSEFDRGVAPANLPLERMILVLKRSPAQQSALNELLHEQQDRRSPNYHKWLTPEQFGQHFGISSQDLEAIIAWLQSQGFKIDSVARGRSTIQFSGTAAQVENTFHAAIHKFVVNGEEHWANANDPQIPAALTPVVAGIATLHTFRKKPYIRVSAQPSTPAEAPGSSRPNFNFADGTHGLAPADYAVIYNINPLYQAGINGSGTSIAVVAKSNINATNVSDFRTIFGLPNNPPQIIVNGTNPGVLSGDGTEATLDTTWSGAVAPNATIKLVVSKDTNASDGTDLSAEYIIQNDLADVMTESYGDCEANYTSADAQNISTRAEQAATQGITYIVSTGDSGSAGCDDPNTEKTATGPLSVNILASTPYTIAAGGTEFDEHGNNSAYWASQANAQGESALSYIPENVWNESCTAAQCGSSNAGIWAGGGGASVLFGKPGWQTGVAGIPNDGARDVPDISLSAASHDPYVLCDQGSCNPTSNPSFYSISGTSASAPSFAGMMALVNQKTGARQGQADPVLYALAGTENLAQCNASSTSPQASTCVFNDVTVGNNAVPGEAGYGTASAKYPAGVGYDLATGLGSVNVATLVNSWNAVSGSGTASISPTSLAFGSVSVPDGSAAQTVTLTNSGGSALNITSIGMSGADPSDFLESNNCGTSLQAGASCTVSVTFAPIADGSRSGSLIFFDSAANSYQTVALSGKGVGGAAFGGDTSGDIRITGDFDGDGKLDVATWRPSNGVWYVYLSSDPGTLTEEQWGLPGDIPVPGDYDGDKKTDYAVWRPSNGTWYIIPSKTRQPYSVQWGASGDIPVLGDFDGDGKADLNVWRPSNQVWYLILSDNPAPFIYQWGIPGDIPVAGDFDGSGKQEMAVWRPSNGTWYVVSGTNAAPFSQQWGLPGDIPVPASYTGRLSQSGQPITDFAVWRPSNQISYILPGANATTSYTEQFAAPTNLLATNLSVGSLGVSQYVRVYGDFDGDGKPDFAVWQPSTGTWYVVPSGSPGSPIVQQWGLPGDVPVPGDYDGDGKADFAVWRPSNGAWYILPSKTPNTSVVQQWGLTGDIPVVADFDGDGKVDYAIWRPSNGTWYITPSNGSAPYAVQWGLNGDIPVPGDFEGTNKSDLAVWRPSNGTWYVVPSNGAGAYALQWGLSGDSPLAGDFDGTGRVDFASWRPGSQSWFIMDSAQASDQSEVLEGLTGNAQVYTLPK